MGPWAGPPHPMQTKAALSHTSHCKLPPGRRPWVCACPPPPPFVDLEGTLGCCDLAAQSSEIPRSWAWLGAWGLSVQACGGGEEGADQFVASGAAQQVPQPREAVWACPQWGPWRRGGSTPPSAATSGPKRGSFFPGLSEYLGLRTGIGEKEGEKQSLTLLYSFRAGT